MQEVATYSTREMVGFPSSNETFLLSKNGVARVSYQGESPEKLLGDHKNMKMLLTTLFVTSALLADDEMRMRNLENRVTSLENSQNGCCYINPPARPFNPDCWGLYVSVDPLLWQANANGLPTAIEPLTKENRVRNFDFDFDFGLRVGLGFNTIHDGWDLLLQWTHFTTDGQRKTLSENQNVLTTQGSLGLTPTSVQNADASYNLSYNLLDLTCGRMFYVSKCLTFRPFTGLRSAWINQKANYLYNETKIEKEDRSFGFGIRGGIEMSWELFRSISLFSNYAANLLYAYDSVKQLEQKPPFQSFAHINKVIHDMQIGLSYDWISCNCCYHLGFDLGWELHLHPGQNQFFNFVSEQMRGKLVTNQGDLGIQGYFLRARFDF